MTRRIVAISKNVDTILMACDTNGRLHIYGDCWVTIRSHMRQHLDNKLVLEEPCTAAPCRTTTNIEVMLTIVVKAQDDHANLTKYFAEEIELFPKWPNATL
eukprot:6474821-Amphidinium_carterae.1